MSLDFIIIPFGIIAILFFLNMRNKGYSGNKRVN